MEPTTSSKDSNQQIMSRTLLLLSGDVETNPGPSGGGVVAISKPGDGATSLPSSSSDKHDGPTTEKLREELSKVCMKWNAIGKHVGISEEILKDNNKRWTDPAKLMNLVVDQWMEDTDHEPITWRRFISILKASGIGETWRADALERLHCPKSYNPANVKIQYPNLSVHSSCQTDKDRLPKKEVKKRRRPIFATSDEPRFDPNFPYLFDFDDLSRQFLRAKLADDNSKLRSSFASLVFRLQKCAANSHAPIEAVTECLAKVDPKYRLLFKGMDGLSRMFIRACDFWSYFDHSIVVVLVQQFGDEKMHKKLTKYKVRYNDYARRLVTEVPINSWGLKIESKDEAIVIKIERSIKTFRVYEMEAITVRMNEIFVGNHLHLTRVIRGCIKLTFKVLPGAFENGLNLTEHQKTELRALGIRSLMYGDEVVDLTDNDGAGDTTPITMEENLDKEKEAFDIYKAAHDEEKKKPPDDDDEPNRGGGVGTEVKGSTSAVDEPMEITTQVVQQPEDTLPDTAPINLRSEQAARQGDLALIKTLIEEGLSPDMLDENGNTLLHIAASYGQLDVMKYLIEDHSMSPVLIGSSGNSPLHCAIIGNHNPVIQYLIETHQFDSLNKNEDNISPLQTACKVGNVETIRYLIEKSLESTALNEMIIVFTEYDLTPLDIACKNGNLELVKYLVTELGCSNETVSTVTRRRSVFYACEMGHIDTVKFFMKELQCHPSVKDYATGGTLLHVAASKGYLDIVRYLSLEVRCDPYLKDAKSNTPLHLSASGGFVDIVQFFVSELKCDPNIPCMDNRTPLHLASQVGCLRIVKFLVETCSCNPSKGDCNLVTPLHLASKGGHLSVVQYLTLDACCDVMIQTADTSTPLHWAAYDGQLKVVKFFIEVLRCPPNIRGRRNQTPLEQASDKGHDNVVEYLRSII